MATKSASVFSMDGLTEEEQLALAISMSLDEQNASKTTATVPEELETLPTDKVQDLDKILDDALDEFDKK